MKTYTTPTGSVIRIEDATLTVTKVNGDVISNVNIGRNDRTEALPAFVSQGMSKSGINPADYRWYRGKAYPLAAAAWLDEQFDLYRKTFDTPAQRAKDAIDDRYSSDMRKAQRAGEDNYEMERRWAEQRRAKALAEWAVTFPAEAAAEAAAARKADLLAQADGLEHAAKQAMLFDADGFLSSADQQARAAEYRRQAAALRAEATL